MDDDSKALMLVKSHLDGSSLQLAGPAGNRHGSIAIDDQAGGSGTKAGQPMRNIPAFLNKVYNMVNDPATDNLIRWTDTGTSFIVPSHEKFGKEMLPRFFKHSNFGSFVRQLNMYGFHKVPHLQQGVLKHDEGERERAEVLEFRNDYFQRDQPDLLYLIQRKKGPGPGKDDGDGLTDGKASTAGTGGGDQKSMTKFQGDLSQLLGEVQALKRHQTLLSTELRDLQNSNRQIWQENLEHRMKADKNQEMIDKILKFLAGVFGGRALNEGGGAFNNGNIAAAESMSGLGLSSYTQSAYAQAAANLAQQSSYQNQHAQMNGTQQQAQSGSSGYELAPRKRRRLLLDSPKKEKGQDGTAEPFSSQFEEIVSDEEAPIIGAERDTSTGIQSVDSSPAQTAIGSFEPIADQQPSQQLQQQQAAVLQHMQKQGQQQPQSSTASGAGQSTQPGNNDFSNIDWPAMNAFFASSASNSNGNANSNGGSNTFSNYDFSNPSFLDSFSLPNSANNPSTSTSSSTQQPYQLALSPQSSQHPNNIDNQALTRYNGLTPPTQDQEVHIRKRLDSLGEQLDKLVAQLPPDFDFSAFQNDINESAVDDDFDFSQYLDNPSDGTIPNGVQTLSSQQDPSDPLSQFLDPALNDESTQQPQASLGTSVPVGTNDVHSSIPRSHQLGSDQPAKSPDVNIHDFAKDEPSATPEAKEESPDTPKIAAETGSGRVGGKAPKKAPVSARGKKRPLAASPDGDDSALSEGRKTRSRGKK